MKPASQATVYALLFHPLKADKYIEFITIPTIFSLTALHFPGSVIAIEFQTKHGNIKM